MKTMWSPNNSARPDDIRSVLGVILHHTASPGSSELAVAELFARRSSGVSAHYVVGESGRTIQCVPLERAAWHAGTCRSYDWDRDGKREDWERYVNSVTIGIEMCNRGDGRDDYPTKQVKAVAKLIRAADKKCPNLKLKNVTDHEAVNLRGKIDVQANFPAAKLFWYILHPWRRMPRNPYKRLPRWAQRQVDEIKR